MKVNKIGTLAVYGVCASYLVNGGALKNCCKKGNKGASENPDESKLNNSDNGNGNLGGGSSLKKLENPGKSTEQLNFGGNEDNGNHSNPEIVGGDFKIGRFEGDGGYDGEREESKENVKPINDGLMKMQKKLIERDGKRNKEQKIEDEKQRRRQELCASRDSLSEKLISKGEKLHGKTLEKERKETSLQLLKEKDIPHKEKCISDCNKNINILLEINERRSNSISEYEDLIKEDKGKIAEKSKELNGLEEKLDAHLKKYRISIEKLRTEDPAVKKSVREQDKKVDKYFKEIKSAEWFISEYNKENQGRQVNIDQNKKEIEDDNKKIKAEMNKIKTLKNDIEGCKKKGSKLEEEIKLIDSEMEKLNNEIGKLNIEKEDIEKEISKLD